MNFINCIFRTGYENINKNKIENIKYEDKLYEDEVQLQLHEPHENENEKIISALLLEDTMMNYSTVYHDSYNYSTAYSSQFNINSSQNIHFFKNCILQCDTPHGLLKMIYNPLYNGFIYSCRFFITNNYIHLCALHYVIKYQCREVLYDAYILDYISTYISDKRKQKIDITLTLEEINVIKEKEISRINKLHLYSKYIRVKKII